MPEIPVADALGALDDTLREIPNRPAVFLLWPKEGEPYLGKTTVLRRRLLRLLRERETPSRLLNLRHAIARVEYWLTGSKLESAVHMYDLARRHFPRTYLDVLRLRMPPYVKLILTNEFPRSQVTTHLGRAPAVYFGPFRTRASAEEFESQFLDLFQVRRCQEDLTPSPAHPGCIYGEMGMCLRPCQQVVSVEEYRHEVDRVVDFLRTDGRSLVEAAGAARDRMSADLDFEQAARQHKRVEKIQEVLSLRDELARDIERLNGSCRHCIRGAARGRALVRPRRRLAGAAARYVRGGGGQARFARSKTSRSGLRPDAGRSAHARTPGISRHSRALVLLELARRRMVRL